MVEMGHISLFDYVMLLLYLKQFVSCPRVQSLSSFCSRSICPLCMSHLRSHRYLLCLSDAEVCCHLCNICKVSFYWSGLWFSLHTDFSLVLYCIFSFFQELCQVLQQPDTKVLKNYMKVSYVVKIALMYLAFFFKHDLTSIYLFVWNFNLLVLHFNYIVNALLI